MRVSVRGGRNELRRWTDDVGMARDGWGEQEALVSVGDDKVGSFREEDDLRQREKGSISCCYLS